MDAWHATYLGPRRLPSELTGFELEAFFSFSEDERKAIEQRREPVLRLSLALQIGFLRMSGCLLDAIDVVPPVLWKHLGVIFVLGQDDWKTGRDRVKGEGFRMYCTTGQDVDLLAIQIKARGAG